MAGLCAPLSTLRQYPRGYLRMTRGRCGSLLLHRDGLAPSTPCRSPGALRFTPERWGNRPDSCAPAKVALFNHLVGGGEKLRIELALLQQMAELASLLTPAAAPGE